MAEVSDNRQPLSKNQLGVGLLVLVLIIAVGVGLYFLLHKSHHHKKGNGQTGKYTAVNPIVLPTVAKLKAEGVKIGGEIFYYAGPKRGFSYEFTRDTAGDIFVRYLPSGSQPNIACKTCLVISTYPNRYLYGLKTQAQSIGATVKSGFGGSSYFINPKRPRDIYMAWPNVPAQVEIFAPTPIEAVKLVTTGKIVQPQ